jgi:PKD repeat protein
VGTSGGRTTPAGRDFANQGAVPRPGIGAVDARSGVAASWNPGRHPRGVGAFALQPTAAGLWVGSDTEYIGDREHFRPRLAFFPLAGGVAPAAGSTTQLPANVYLGSPGATNTDVLSRRFFDGKVASAASPAASDDMAWSTVRAATMIDGELWYGRTGTPNTFYRRTFDGTTYGPARQVDPYNDPKWSLVTLTGTTTTTYRGVVPNFYGEISTTTGLAFRDGQLYSTRGGVLYAGAFNPESGVVSGVRRQVAAISGIGGIFFSGGDLWFSNTSTGTLSRVAFVNGAPSGPATTVSGPAIDGIDWRARTLFTGPGPDAPAPDTNAAPTASFVATCSGMTCNFDGAGSTDPDGSISSHSWSFGDGTAGSGTTASRTYASSGTYQVTLTVTDNGGATATSTQPVTIANTSGISLTAALGAKAKGGAGGQPHVARCADFIG